MLKLQIANRLPKSAVNGCYLVFLFEDGKLRGLARKLDKQHGGLIQRVFAARDFTGKAEQCLLLAGLDTEQHQRILLVGLGARNKVGVDTFRKASIAAAKELASISSSQTHDEAGKTGAGKADNNAADKTGILVSSDVLSSLSIDSLSAIQIAELLTREIHSARYRFLLHPSQQIASPPQLMTLALSCEQKLLSDVQLAAEQGLATAQGMHEARDLGNLAPNICTPTYLATQAIDYAAQFDNFTTDVIDEKQMQELKMGALLAVSAGSQQPGKLIVMNYQGKKRAGKPVVLVGKGITFDTGGISIKSSDGMDEMKFDMCGAASVFGVMHALGSLQPEINVIGIVAAAENMPDGRACRPGDVVTSMSGKSIEILNTDAEGRLVLCDALTYAQQFNPATVIDIATLTGASVVALGHHMSALFGNDQDTIDALLDAGKASGDPAWPMPMGSEYQAQLDSNFADMANIGGRAAGAVTAACFLSRFTEDVHWAHLDIAGVAWHSGKDKGATGRPVPLLLSYVLDTAQG